MLSFFRQKKKSEDGTFVSTFGDAGSVIGCDGARRYVGPVSPEWGVLFVVLSLLLIGSLMVYSASISLSDASKYNVSTNHYLIRQVISIAIGMLAAVTVVMTPMNKWNKYAPWVFVFTIFLLIMVLVPGVGKNVNNASRWIPLGIFNLQVTELMKVAALIYAASFTVRKQEFLHTIRKGVGPMGVAFILVSWLVSMQPDLGALIMIVAIAFGVLFIGGLNLRLFGVLLVLVVCVVCSMVFFSPWRMARMMAYLDPWGESSVLGKGYQLSHSLIAFGRGETTGVGLGDAIEKQHYLPEAHTDFIMAIIAEELGFVGVIAVLFLLLWLIRRCFEIGRKAIRLDRVFSGLVAQGVAVWFGVQTFINVGVASGLLPTKGLTLPFVSYGGSALLSSLIAVALVLRVDYENKVILRGGSV